MTWTWEKIIACERANVTRWLKDYPEPEPPLTEEELHYLAKYKATAMVCEDGSDEGDWLGNFLKHRQQLERLI